MLLALETSDRLCAACLIDKATGAVATARTIDIGRGHAERLMGLIAEVMDAAGVSHPDLTGLAVCVGPGSFTGIRVGLAAAAGLSIALNLSVQGVTSLQALALSAAGETHGRSILALVDAHRGDVYAQTFDGAARPLDAPRQVSVAEAAQMAKENGILCVGAGAEAVMAALPDARLTTVESLLLPDVAMVARAALDPAMTVTAKPLYLRRPDAKPQEAYTAARALR